MTADLRDIEPAQVHVWRADDRRRVLAPYLRVQPEEIEFGQAEHGKPTIVWPQTDIRFNLSHSGDLELMAVAVGREVGIDVERIEPARATEAIAQRFFSPDELVALGRAELGNRVECFFELWTVKEARLKALGVGLAGLDASAGTDVPTVRLDLPTGWVGCVAVEAGPIELVQLQL